MLVVTQRPDGRTKNQIWRLLRVFVSSGELCHVTAVGRLLVLPSPRSAPCVGRGDRPAGNASPPTVHLLIRKGKAGERGSQRAFWIWGASVSWFPSSSALFWLPLCYPAILQSLAEKPSFRCNQVDPPCAYLSGRCQERMEPEVRSGEKHNYFTVPYRLEWGQRVHTSKKQRLSKRCVSPKDRKY